MTQPGILPEGGTGGEIEFLGEGHAARIATCGQGAAPILVRLVIWAFLDPMTNPYQVSPHVFFEVSFSP
jgi:hypothetical protein